MRIPALAAALLLAASLPAQAGTSTDPALRLPFDAVTGERAQAAPGLGALPGLGMAATLAAHISTAGPLTDIWIGEDLSCQVRTVWAPDAAEFYPASEGPGDCGTFVALDGLLYGPDFGSHPGGTAATGDLGPDYVPFTPVSQTAFGTGVPAAPFTVVTEVALGATGYRLTQVDSYEEGAPGYKTQLAITDHTLKQARLPAEAVVYHAGDCTLFGDDNGLGVLFVAPVGCQREGEGSMHFASSLDARGMEDRYYEVWAAVASQAPFTDTCLCSPEHDNAMGLSWEVTVPSGVSMLVGTFYSLWHHG